MGKAKKRYPSYRGCCDVYCSYPEGHRSRAEEYAAFLRQHDYAVCSEQDMRALTECGNLLVFLTPYADLTTVRQDVTYALSHGKKIICVHSGNTELDNGLTIQLGLAEKIADDAEAFEKVLSAIEIPTLLPRKRRRLPIAAALVAVAVVGALLLCRNKPREASAPAEEHIAMESALRDGLIQNGVDTSGDGGISKEELEQATELDLSCLGITDISPLAAASGVVTLDLGGNKIDDITPLAGMKELQSVNLSGNAIKDFSVLDYLPNLIEQDISSQHIS